MYISNDRFKIIKGTSIVECSITKIMFDAQLWLNGSYLYTKLIEMETCTVYIQFKRLRVPLPYIK